MRKMGGFVFLILLVIAVYYIFFNNVAEYPDMSKAVFATYEVKLNDTTGTIKLALNPNSTCTISYVNSRGENTAGNGNWELLGKDDMYTVKLTASSGFSGQLGLYKNKEASYTLSSYNFFGKWYQ